MSEPHTLRAGEWHLPYVSGYDEAQLRRDGYSDDELCRISIGRCTRVSYLTHDGVRDPKADLALTNEKLLPSGHMSPTEHPLQALSQEEWRQYAQFLTLRWVEDRVPVGNVWGFKQFRKTLKDEHNFALLKRTRT
jgi:hypothetical protein